MEFRHPARGPRRFRGDRAFILELLTREKHCPSGTKSPALSFFGEAKEAGSLRSIENVQVKAELGARRIMVQTNVEGRFKLHPNFGKEVLSDSITISCAKEGYSTLDVSRRRMSSAPDAPVEVDCLLEPKK